MRKSDTPAKAAKVTEVKKISDAQKAEVEKLKQIAEAERIAQLHELKKH